MYVCMRMRGHLSSPFLERATTMLIAHHRLATAKLKEPVSCYNLIMLYTMHVIEKYNSYNYNNNNNREYCNSWYFIDTVSHTVLISSENDKCRKLKYKFVTVQCAVVCLNIKTLRVLFSIIL